MLEAVCETTEIVFVPLQQGFISLPVCMVTQFVVTLDPQLEAFFTQRSPSLDFCIKKLV